jgi:hypothetical protein
VDLVVSSLCFSQLQLALTALLFTTSTCTDRYVEVAKAGNDAAGSVRTRSRHQLCNERLILHLSSSTRKYALKRCKIADGAAGASAAAAAAAAAVASALSIPSPVVGAVQAEFSLPIP